MNNNQIVDPTPLSKLTSLITLGLHNNQIIDLSFIKDLTNVTEIGLVYNQIKELPEWITEIHLEINIQDDPDVSTNRLLLAGNPIQSPPIKVVKKGKQAIQQHFQELKK